MATTASERVVDAPGRAALLARVRLGRLGLPAVVAAALLLLEAPRWLVGVAGPTDRVFGGTFRNIFDAHVYLAAAHQAAESGTWLHTNQLTAEPHRGAFVHALYLAMGHLSRLLGAPVADLFRLAEVGGRALALLGVAAVAWSVLRGAERWLGLGLAVAGGSLAFWAAGISLATGRPLAGSLSFEDDTLTLLLSAPHLQLGLAALLLLVPTVARAERGRRYLAAAALLALVLSLTVSYALAPVLAWLWTATLLWQRSRRGLRLATAVTAAAAPVLLYTTLTVAVDPFWGTILSRQNEVPTPEGPDFLVHVGAGLLLAPLVGLAWHGQWSLERRLLLLLAALTLAALFVPVPYQRRLGFGLAAELGLIAAATIAWLFCRVPRGWPRQVLVAAVALAFFPTALLGYFGSLQSALGGAPYPVYVAARAEVEAAHALDRLAGPSDAVLSTLETGYAIVPWIRARVVLGHPHETLAYRDKRSRVDAFFAAQLEAERVGLLADLGATLLFVGPRERAVLRFEPAQSPALELVWQAADASVAIYRVHPR